MKVLSLALLALFAVSGSTLARADYCNWHDCGHHHHDDDDDGNVLATLATLYSFSTTTLSDDDRATYVQNVQDDAAAYLAGGDESALLQDAIRRLRTEKAVTGSDTEIATALIGQ